MWRTIMLSCLTLMLPLCGSLADDLTRKQGIAAKKLYDAKCAKCHRFYEPSEYSQEEWQLWMAKMSKKAKLNPGQDKLLNHYLDAYRAHKTPLRTSVPAPGRQVVTVLESPKSQLNSAPGSAATSKSSQSTVLK